MKKPASQGIKAGRGFELLPCHGALGEALHYASRLNRAEEEFRKAETLRKSLDPERPFLYAFHGFRHWRLLLTQGNFREVSGRLGKALAIAAAPKKDLDIAHCHLIAGLSQLLQVESGKTGDLSLATARIEEAVAHLRSAARQDELPRGLLARARLYVELRRFGKAEEDLETVLRIAKRSKMQFFEADGYLNYPRLHIARGDRPSGHRCWQHANNMIQTLGYWRLKTELAFVKHRLEQR